jgi:hypothetical protein
MLYCPHRVLLALAARIWPSLDFIGYTCMRSHRIRLDFNIKTGSTRIKQRKHLACLKTAYLFCTRFYFGKKTEKEK